MNLKEKLQKIWENRSQIAEGVFNLYLSTNTEVKQEAARRLAICEQCEYWDPTGTSEKLVNKGHAGCTGCGCRGDIKTNCMSCDCYLSGVEGQEAKWVAVMTEEQDKEYHQKEWEQQFNK